MKKYKLLLVFVFTLLCNTILASNVQITNVTRPANDILKFDVSWENSWYLNTSPNNWDAVWVFIKAQDCNTELKEWKHADVSTNSSDHNVSGGILQVDAVTDGKGVFIRRTNHGFGNIPTASVEVKLQNATYPNNGTVNFEVLGIEMVAVLTGDFQVGNAHEATHSFETTTISSENAINSGALIKNTNNKSSNATLPNDFPKGYDQFYIMKYEISQNQYAKFLNLLSYNQQFFRTSNPPTASPNTNALSDQPNGIRYRNGIILTAPGSVSNGAEYGADYNDNTTVNESDDGQSIACNFLKWTDLLAYLDWAALRPMTELEYEKACRGENSAVTDEYAWGNKIVHGAKSISINNDGQGSETSTTTAPANHGVAAVLGKNETSSGPLRVGFAASQGSPTRLSAGASYWGVLDLTGNVWEQTVSAGFESSNISSFTGGLGDGEITSDGKANQADWELDPLYSLVKGGSWMSGALLPDSAYCFPTSNSNKKNINYHISRFRLANVDHSTPYTDTIYNDYTAQVEPILMYPGQPYTPYVTVSNGYRPYVRVWIDENNNGQFESTERVSYYGTSGTINGEFAIPDISVSLPPGSYRLRVAYSQYYAPSANGCDPANGNYWSSGSEIEDYTLVVGGLDPVGSRVNIGDTKFNADRHPATGGRGVRQF
ncbi:hypothetical protein CW751_08550 [Brumimicrobium salinarum]|uniref:Uncharacterized protein n=1 Tax=Brumimicrobium salinarum TaxID=2058658 RepID=A0A2I0R2J9_9FLAO|nr:SUMF1/EgtB/PvdO family nonheme iron enzyme [Brumimicrobium salinarum]PKR80808.1 hypothetical protein CW751_08550 [Brumimicrobium salinarum]